MENIANCAPRWIGNVEPSPEVRAMSMASIFEMECREQTHRLSKLIEAYATDGAIGAALDKGERMAGTRGPLLFLGMGASFCSALAASVVLQSCGRLAFTADAGEWLHYSLPVWDQFAASILLTTSGESAELVRLCEQRPPHPLGLICNNEKSPCWAAVPVRLPILAGPEYGNATKTYTNSTAAAIVLASRMAGRPWLEGAHQLLQVYGDSLNWIFSRRAEITEFCQSAANIEVIGRGPAYGGALIGALCIREMSGRRAAGHSGAGFRHGPLLDVNQSHVAIIMALGRAAELGRKLAQDCIARGGKVVLVDTEEQAPFAQLLPITVSAVPEPWDALTSVLVPQALTLGLIERFGANLKPRFAYGLMRE